MQVPEKIRAAFESLKRAYGVHIELKYLNKRFCVFEATSKYDRDIGRSRKKTNYLGWITEEGVVVPARHRETGRAAQEQRYRKRIEALENEINGTKPAQPTQEATSQISKGDMNILTALSMNSRLPYGAIGKVAGIPGKSVPYRIKRMEAALGIKYTIEMNATSLGFSTYFIFVKFEDSEPAPEAISAALDGEGTVQLALLTKGDYDLVIYCVAENNYILNILLDRIRKHETFMRVPAVWTVTPVDQSYGFMQFRDKFFGVLIEKVWVRSKNNPRPSAHDLLYREYAVLKELNSDSTTSFSEIDKGYALPLGGSKNAYGKLTSSDMPVIARPTISISRPNIKYVGLIFLDIINKGMFIQTRSRHRKYILNEPEAITNRFSYLCDFETPDGIMYIIPVYHEGELEAIGASLSSILSGIKIRYAVVREVLVGSINYRRFDNEYSSQYENLIKEKLIGPKERKNYALH